MERFPFLGEKLIEGAAEGREPWLQRKVRESGIHRDKHKGKACLKSLAQKFRS